MHDAKRPTVAPALAERGVPLVDMQRQFRAIENDLIDAVTRVCRSGRYILGPEMAQLETELAGVCQAKHAIACASGSDALLLALAALDIGPGDEVIVPSFTFFATASAVARLGARVVFADIEPRHHLIDPASVARAITSRTRAVIPVHLYGQCADLDALGEVVAGRKIAVIEDSAQAIGAEYRGRRTGALGDMACLSFYPTKNLGGIGDGGMLTTDDDRLAARLRLLRVHGMEPRYHHQVLGINSRLDTIQAAALLVKVPHLEAWTESRRRVAAGHQERFRARGLDAVLGLPAEMPHRRHVWNQFVVRVRDGRRDELRAHLAARKIGTEIYYPIPVHRQACFAGVDCGGGPLPETDRAAAEVLALPMFPELTWDEQDFVVTAIESYFRPNTNVVRADAGHAGVPAPRTTGAPGGVKAG
jgi:dTDP-4-amino-4,6-dideoxygalactose transaminase